MLFLNNVALSFSFTTNAGNNDLLGLLPAEIGFLTELTSLHIHENRMHGGLPDTLGDLANITHLE